MTFFLAYLFCGLVVGFFAGMFGIGGGIISIPALLFLFNLQGMTPELAMHMAIGTSLTIVIITATVSTWSHYQKRMIVFPVFKKFIPGAVVGSAIGVLISSHLSHIYLERIFGFFLLLIAVQMFFHIEVKQEPVIEIRRMWFAPLFLGMLSGLLGLGGGIFTVPYFVWHGMSMRHAIATAAACILPVALVGSVGYMMTSVTTPEADQGMFMYHTGFIYWPAFLGMTLTSVLIAPLGVRIAHTLSTHLLKKGFAIFIMMVGLSMLIKG